MVEWQVQQVVWPALPVESQAQQLELVELQVQLALEVLVPLLQWQCLCCLHHLWSV